MLLFYIRHGDPIYRPDSLTPLGKRQAEAVAKRLCLYGIDKVFASSSTRASMTSDPTCEIMKIEKTEVDFAHEDRAWEFLSAMRDDNSGKTWAFAVPSVRRLFVSPEVLALKEKWYEHPAFAEYEFKKGIERCRVESDEFLASLGYEHIPGTGAYKPVAPTEERVALFAHHGFGMSFLSCLLDIPYPQFCMHFDMSHTGMTVIEFKDEGDGIVIPKVLTLSNDSHLYREGLPTKYSNRLYF